MATQLFSGLTAWFSKSVSRGKKLTWRNGGGQEFDLDQAQYVFSQDATHEDTIRLYHSDAYLNEHLSIFHGNYISQCVKVGSVDNAALGKYLLPPKDVQDIARKQISFAWELDGNGQDSDSEGESRTGDNPHPQIGKQPQNDTTTARQTAKTKSPQSKQKSPVKAIATVSNQAAADERLKPDDVQTQTATLTEQVREASPRKSELINRKDINTETKGSSRKRSPTKSKSPNQTLVHAKDTRDGKSAPKRNRNSSNSVNDEVSKQNVPKNKDADCTEWLRLEDLTKVSGMLIDFVIGVNGCKVDKNEN